MCTADFELQTRSFSDLCLSLKFRTLALEFVNKLLSFLSNLAWTPAGLALLGQQVQCLFIGIPKTSLFVKEILSFAEKIETKISQIGKKYLALESMVFRNVLLQ